MKHVNLFENWSKAEPITEDANARFVYIVIDQDMHSYEAILGIYDSFERAMKSPAWSNRGVVPNSKGEGDSLFIYKEEVNKDLVTPHGAPENESAS